MGLLGDKVVVVTGAGRGIGRGEALECARQGAAVVVGEFAADAGEEGVGGITAAAVRAPGRGVRSSARPLPPGFVRPPCRATSPRPRSPTRSSPRPSSGSAR